MHCILFFPKRRPLLFPQITYIYDGSQGLRIGVCCLLFEGQPYRQLLSQLSTCTLQYIIVIAHKLLTGQGSKWQHHLAPDFLGGVHILCWRHTVHHFLRASSWLVGKKTKTIPTLSLRVNINNYLLSYLMLFSKSNLTWECEYTEFKIKEGSIGDNVSSAFCLFLICYDDISENLGCLSSF